MMVMPGVDKPVIVITCFPSHAIVKNESVSKKKALKAMVIKHSPQSSPVKGKVATAAAKRGRHAAPKTE